MQLLDDELTAFLDADTYYIDQSVLCAKLRYNTQVSCMEVFVDLSYVLPLARHW
jgi:hypothetical protein